MSLKAAEMEVAIADRFDLRKNILVPNIQAGMGLHEVDVLMLRPTGYATEFEIKISKGDLMKDFKKDHHHASNMINEMYYAVPMNLVRHTMRVIPKEMGIVGVLRTPQGFKTDIIREAVPNKDARKWTDAERMQLLRLAYIRSWQYRKKLMGIKHRHDLKNWKPTVNHYEEE
jgi:hypothetical protein